MPKHTTEEIKTLMQKAFRLLDEGNSKDEIAAQLNVSSRTIHRWIKAKEDRPQEIKAQDDLAGLVYNPLPKLAEPQPIEMSEPGLMDLQDFHSSQKFFAIALRMIAASLQPKIQVGLEAIQPEDVTPRSLPALIKCYIELVNAGSDCWARAVGLDQVLERVTKLENNEQGE